MEPVLSNLLSGTIDLRFVPQDGGRLARQIYDRLRTAILSGALPRGYRLPSSRGLAEDFGVSRNTVSTVIDQLAVEGYIVVARGRRPVVAAVEKMQLVSGDQSPDHERSGFMRVSRWARQVSRSDWHFTNEGGSPRPFAPGLADAREFPHEVWARCLRRAARSRHAAGIRANHPALRSALLSHLVEHRGVKADARRLIITSSAQAAIELISRVLLNEGDLAWIESPGYGGARVALEATGARVKGMTLDRSGLRLAGRTDRPRLIFCTPSHQYPTGRLMPIKRRQELLAFAAEAGAAIIEDDYDSEFHFDGRPVVALQGIDTASNVFYVGTFSKPMLPDIRVGYAIVPDSLVETFERMQRHTGQMVMGAMQLALAEFIGDGDFAAHIRRMTRIYRGRRDHLTHALASAAGSKLAITPPAGGMQLLARLEPGSDDCRLVADLARIGVTARPLSRHFTGKTAEHGLFLGFAAWNETEIDAGAELIGKTIARNLRGR
ncbi:PLP-dependent aminotransferase family protein [Bradyrhizobium sp. AUGA SZCCT0182]|nr:PLP-dependent aminotransferase family protein [Bradyrhizobium sp. AUGA SZCCT0182]